MSEFFVVEILGTSGSIVLPEGQTPKFRASPSPIFEVQGPHFIIPGHARLAAARPRRLQQVLR